MWISYPPKLWITQHYVNRNIASNIAKMRNVDNVDKLSTISVDNSKLCHVDIASDIASDRKCG